MEINVGDYVIQKDRLKIGQVKDFCECEMCKDRGFYEPIIDNDIYITNYDKDNNFKNYTFSKDIIYLIEVGDYVNGRKVIFTKNNFPKGYYKNNKNDVVFTDYNDEYGEWFGFESDEIETVLTHEQFESNAYKIEKEM